MTTRLVKRFKYTFYFSDFFFPFSRRDTLRNSLFLADAGAANAIDPMAKLLQQRGMFVWVMMVFTGLQRGLICVFFFCALGSGLCLAVTHDIKTLTVTQTRA